MELFTGAGILLATVMGLAWYWITAVVLLILLSVAFSNDEDFGGETWLFIGILVLIGWTFWGQVSIAGAILFAAYYLVVGSVWSVLNYARTIKAEIKDAKASGYTTKDMPLSHFQKAIKKNRIVRWIAYWPFSIVNYVIGDFLANVFERIIGMLGNTYSRITKHYYEKLFAS